MYKLKILRSGIVNKTTKGVINRNMKTKLILFSFLLILFIKDSKINNKNTIGIKTITPGHPTIRNDKTIANISPFLKLSGLYADQIKRSINKKTTTSNNTIVVRKK